MSTEALVEERKVRDLFLPGYLFHPLDELCELLVVDHIGLLPLKLSTLEAPELSLVHHPFLGLPLSGRSLALRQHISLRLNDPPLPCLWVENLSNLLGHGLSLLKEEHRLAGSPDVLQIREPSNEAKHHSGPEVVHRVEETLGLEGFVFGERLSSANPSPEPCRWSCRRIDPADGASEDVLKRIYTLPDVLHVDAVDHLLSPDRLFHEL